MSYLKNNVSKPKTEFSIALDKSIPESGIIVRGVGLGVAIKSWSWTDDGGGVGTGDVV